MRISFDLDGTIFVSDPLESGSSISDSVGRDKGAALRGGTRELMAALAERGWEIWFYTNSLRSRSSLLDLAGRLNMPVRDPSHIVNQQIHENRCAEMGFAPVQVPAKMPRWFGINLHVDDCPELARQISEDGCAVCLIAKDDSDWVAKVLASADALQAGPCTGPDPFRHL